jgi:hypothetical protein
MDLGDHAIAAPLDHKGHMRPARAACVRSNDHAKTAVGREGERARLFDAKLRPKDVHGASSNGWWTEDTFKANPFVPGSPTCSGARSNRQATAV